MKREQTEAISGIRNDSSTLVIGLALVVATLWTFWEVQDHEFLLWDDYEYVVENPHLKSGLSIKGILWAFTSTYASYWHPLTWLSLMLDWELYGLNPKGYHLNNLLLHAANALLLFLLLNRMTRARWQSAFVAALFAIHPLRVESVAWVTERKDVLSALFWMLTLWAYLLYTERPGIGRYSVVLLFFTLGLMAKPMLVTLPFVLLLLDYWPLGRLGLTGKRPPTPGPLPPARPSLGRILLEKAPLLGLALLSGAWTYFATSRLQSVATVAALSIKDRMANAVFSYADYLWKMLWPANLAFFYPHPLDSLPAWQIAGSFLLITGFSILFVLVSRRRPYLFVGWFWYIVTILPVIGLVQVGAQAMADRFTYVPLIGPSLAISWLIPEILPRWPFRRVALFASAGMILFLLLWAARSEVPYWKNGVTLFERAIQVTRDNYTAHFQLGNELARQGKPEEAVLHFSEALRINPGHIPSRHSIAAALVATGKTEDALLHYAEALQFNPKDTRAILGQGNIFAVQGDLDMALSLYNRAIGIDPGNWMAHTNLGFVLMRQGREREAILHFSEALRINPEDRVARNNLGVLLKGRQKAPLPEGRPQ